MPQSSLFRLKLIDSPYDCRIAYVTESSGVLRHHPHQLRWYAQHSQLIVAADVLDRTEVILRRHLTDRDKLDPVLLAIRRVHEQVPEVARAFAVLHRLAQVVDEILVLGHVRHVQDEPGMAPVLVILAAEQRC